MDAYMHTNTHSFPHIFLYLMFYIFSLSFLFLSAVVMGGGQGCICLIVSQQTKLMCTNKTNVYFPQDSNDTGNKLCGRLSGKQQ